MLTLALDIRCPLSRSCSFHLGFTTFFRRAFGSKKVESECNVMRKPETSLLILTVKRGWKRDPAFDGIDHAMLGLFFGLTSVDPN